MKKKRVRNRKLIEKIKSQRCVINDTCWGAIDPSHITSVGAGGRDAESNVVAMCRKHHTEWHAYGLSKFIKYYPQFRDYLEALGRWDVLDKLKRLSKD